MSQKARIRQTRKDIVSRQPWIILQDIRFGLSGGEQFQDKFDGQSSASDYGSTGEDSGIDHNAIGPRHSLMIPQALRAPEAASDWLGRRDSNPDTQLQRLQSYRWTTSQQR